MSTADRVLVAIATLTDYHGIPPTVGEVATLTGLSRSGVCFWIESLLRAGWVVRADGAARCWLVAPDGRERLGELTPELRAEGYRRLTS